MMKKRGRNLKKLEAALRLLQETGELPARYRPHPLRGELAGCLVPTSNRTGCCSTRYCPSGTSSSCAARAAT